METARLAFGAAQSTNEVRGGPANPDDPKRYEPLRKLLAVPPAPRAQQRHVEPRHPFYALFGPPYLAEGEMAVVEPARGKPRIVGKIRLEDWGALAR